MKRKLIFRPDALANLNEVENYTKQAWGKAQAKRCAAALVADIKTLRISDLRHALYNDVYPGLRHKRSGMHHIYYFASDESVEILKIIHVQRDPGLHLKVNAWPDNE